MTVVKVEIKTRYDNFDADGNCFASYPDFNQSYAEQKAHKVVRVEKTFHTVLVDSKETVTKDRTVIVDQGWGNKVYVLSTSQGAFIGVFSSLAAAKRRAEESTAYLIEWQTRYGDDLVGLPRSGTNHAYNFFIHVDTVK